jgi:hypothetical protein
MCIAGKLPAQKFGRDWLVDADAVESRLQAEIVKADHEACNWLAEANRLLEAGKTETRAYAEAERKAQIWLDRWNDLEGKGNG